MAKAKLTLPNGTVVNIEGTTEEVSQLLDFYAGEKPRPGTSRPGEAHRRARGKTVQDRRGRREGQQTPDLAEIVNLVKACDEAEQIETNVLDQASAVNRTLLPLYVVHQYLDNAFGLTSGDIAKITTDLGAPVSQPSASRALSGTASRYVIGDKVRKKGQPVHYKISRRGVQYMRSVIRGAADEDQT